MSFGNAIAYTCKDLQVKYVDYFGKNAAQYRTGGSVALIKYLLSPQNTRGFRKINVTSIPGKKRPVAFMVNSPYCFEVANPAVTCTTEKDTITANAGEVVFDLDGPAFRVVDSEGNPLVLEFTREQLAKYCTETDQSYIQEQIIRFLMRYEEALAKQLAAMLETQVGKTSTGADILRLPFFVNNNTTNTSNINPDAIWHLAQEYLNAGNEGQFAMVGGLVAKKIADYQKWSGLNAAGIDLAKIDDMNPYVYYDRNMDSILGADSFLQMSPGAVQLVTYNENVGPYKTEVTALYSNGTIISPLTGMEIDWKWRYDYECEKWKFEPYSYVELAVNKAGGCGDLSGVNGIIRVQDCSSAIEGPVCPE